MHFLLRPILFPHFWAISLLNYTENQEKQETYPLEKILKNPVETAPRNCRFLSLVVVEGVLIGKQGYFLSKAGIVGVGVPSPLQNSDEKQVLIETLFRRGKGRIILNFSSPKCCDVKAAMSKTRKRCDSK